VGGKGAAFWQPGAAKPGDSEWQRKSGRRRKKWHAAPARKAAATGTGPGSVVGLGQIGPVPRLSFLPLSCERYLCKQA